MRLARLLLATNAHTTYSSTENGWIKLPPYSRHRSRTRYLSKKNSRILTNFPKLKKFVQKFVKCPSVGLPQVPGTRVTNYPGNFLLPDGYPGSEYLICRIYLIGFSELVHKNTKQTYKAGLHFTVICCTNKCIINERYIPKHQNKLNLSLIHI